MIDVLFPLMDSIFTGTIVLVICIIATLIFKIRLQLIDLKTLIIAVNWVLLLGGLLFLANISARAFNAYYNGGEYEQYVFLNSLGVNQVIILTMLWLLTHGFIPQLLWFKKFRQSITISGIVVGIWAANYFIEPIIVAHQRSWLMFYPITLRHVLSKATIYVAILSVVYLLIWKRFNSDKSTLPANS